MPITQGVTEMWYFANLLPSSGSGSKRDGKFGERLTLLCCGFFVLKIMKIACRYGIRKKRRFNPRTARLSSNQRTSESFHPPFVVEGWPTPFGDFSLRGRSPFVPDRTITERISPAIVPDHITALVTCYRPGVQKDFIRRREMRMIGVGISPK